MLARCPAGIPGVALLVALRRSLSLWSRAGVSSNGSLGGVVGTQAPLRGHRQPLSLVPRPNGERARAGTSLESEISWLLSLLFPRIDSRVLQAGHTEGRE